MRIVIARMNDISVVEQPIAASLVATRHILLAEDDVHVRRLYVKILVGSGYGVDAAKNGEVAWAALQIKSYHLLITDHDMPKMSGVELVKKMRAVGMTLPIIMVSGTMPIEELKAHSSLRISAILPKPHSVGDLLKTVREILGATADAGEHT